MEKLWTCPTGLSLRPLAALAINPGAVILSLSYETGVCGLPLSLPPIGGMNWHCCQTRHWLSALASNQVCGSPMQALGCYKGSARLTRLVYFAGFSLASEGQAHGALPGSIHTRTASR